MAQGTTQVNKNQALTQIEAYELCRQINTSKSGWYAAAEPVDHKNINGNFRLIVRQLPQSVMETTQTVRNLQDWETFHAKHLPNVPMSGGTIAMPGQSGGAYGNESRGGVNAPGT